MNLTVWQALKYGFMQPFTLQMICITIVYILWLIVLSVEEQEKSDSVKNLMFANLATKSLRIHPHGTIAKKAAIFSIAFVLACLFNLLKIITIKSFFLVLGGVFLVLLGLDTFGLLYLVPLFKNSEAQNLRSTKRFTAIFLGITLGLTWKGPAGNAYYVVLSGLSTQFIFYLAGLTISFIVLALLLNIIFNIFPFLKKFKKVFISLAGLLFISIGFLTLLGQCPSLG